MSAVLTPPGVGPSVAAPVRPVVRGPGRREPPVATHRSTGLAVVVLVHALIFWALASGLAQQAIEIIKKPISLSIVPEDLPPPPPPPPKVEKIRDLPKVVPPPSYVPPPEVTPVAPPPAPVITATQAEPPKEPVVIAPPPPPTPAPEPKPAAVKQEISLACPGYQTVLADMLEDAFDRVGIVGTVRTKILVRGNQIVDAVAVSGPKEYAKYVQAAIKRMKCSAGGADEVQFQLDVNFRR